MYLTDECSPIHGICNAKCLALYVLMSLWDTDSCFEVACDRLLLIPEWMDVIVMRAHSGFMSDRNCNVWRFILLLWSRCLGWLWLPIRCINALRAERWARAVSKAFFNPPTKMLCFWIHCMWIFDRFIACGFLILALRNNNIASSYA